MQALELVGDVHTLAEVVRNRYGIPSVRPRTSFDSHGRSSSVTPRGSWTGDGAPPSQFESRGSGGGGTGRPPSGGSASLESRRSWVMRSPLTMRGSGISFREGTGSAGSTPRIGGGSASPGGPTRSVSEGAESADSGSQSASARARRRWERLR